MASTTVDVNDRLCSSDMFPGPRLLGLPLAARRSISRRSLTSHHRPARRRLRYPILALAAAVSFTLLPLDDPKTPSPPYRGASQASMPQPYEASSSSESLETSSRLPAIQSFSTPALIRTYLVYTLCSFPTLIDHAPSVLKALTSLGWPVRPVAEFAVRHTFFAQFVPGETVAGCRPTMEALWKSGIGVVLNYSAEADEPSGDVRALEDARMREVELALDEGGRFEEWVVQNGGQRGTTGFALKVTGLVDPEVLRRASTTLLRFRPLTQSNSPSSPSAVQEVPYPGTPTSEDARVVASSSDGKTLLSLKGNVEKMGIGDMDEGLRDGDVEKLRVLWVKLRAIAERAESQRYVMTNMTVRFALIPRVKLFIDAEHTWYQPALDAYTLLLSQEFNRPPKDPKSRAQWSGPLILFVDLILSCESLRYSGTYQSYLTRQPQHLLSAIQHAEKNGYALGIKLVRGAYFQQEREQWKREGRTGPDPIWPE